MFDKLRYKMLFLVSKHRAKKAKEKQNDTFRKHIIIEAAEHLNDDNDYAIYNSFFSDSEMTPELVKDMLYMLDIPFYVEKKENMITIRLDNSKINDKDNE